MRPCARCPSASTASISRVDASPRAGPHRPRAPGSIRRARKTSYSAQSRPHRTDAPFFAAPAQRSSCASCSRRPRPPLLCGGPAPSVSFPPLFLLRSSRATALYQDCLHPRDVLAQPTNLLQALVLSHVHLELQLEELIGEIPLLVAQLNVGQISDFVYLHKLALSFKLSAFTFIPHRLPADS